MVPGELEESIKTLSLDGHSNELEQVLVERLGRWTPKDGIVAKYLVACLLRAERTGRTDRVVSELKYLLLSYVGLVLTMPAMFSQPDATIDQGPKALVPLIMGIDQNDVAMSPKLLGELIGRFSEDCDMMTELFEPILFGIVSVMQQQGILGKFIAGLDSLQLLLARAEIRKVLIGSDSWKPSCEAVSLGNHTILGGILSIGVDTMELGPLLELLPSREQHYSSQVESAFYSLRTALQMHFSRTHQLFYSLIKSDAACKEAILDWLGWFAGRNKDRLKMHVDPKTVTPDRILYNGFVVLLKFCEPFLSPSSPKVSMIDSEYYYKSKRIDISEATKNRATKEEYKEFVSQFQEQPYSANFVTECFFLTVQYFRLGPVRMINEYMDLLRHLRDAQQALESFEASQQNGGGNPMNSLAIKNAQAQVQKMKDGKLALDVYLLDPQLMEGGFALITLVVSWMMSLIPDNVPSVPPKTFAMLPEFLVESVGEYALFISRFYPQFWLGNRPLDALMKFMVIILDRPAYVKNPYLRAKFVDFFYGFTDPRLEHFFDLYPVVVEHFASKLMRFYIGIALFQV